MTSDYDSRDENWRVDRVNSDLSDPDHEQGAADTTDSPDCGDRGESSGDELDSGALSDQINLFPINCERAKYIEVKSVKN